MSELKGASVLITGGGSGIGAGTARYLAEHGAKVTICGRRADRLEEVQASLGNACHAVPGDICNAADRETIVAGALEHGGKLDALINNAGNMYRGPLVELQEAELLQIFHTNVVAGMMMSGLCRSHLAATNGAIVFIGSIHNRRAFPQVSPYAATKGAIEALTKSLAAELGDDGIRVNCVAPGAVFTEINQRAGLVNDAEARARLESITKLQPLRRIGETREIAEAIAYFITAEWTTGTVIEVDGGLALGLTEGK